MNRKTIYVVMAAMIMAMATAAWSQTATVNGKIKSGDKPVPEAQITFTAVTNGKIYKVKADKSGNFTLLGIVRGDYDMTVSDASGKTIFQQKRTVGAGGDTDTIEIDVSTVVSKEEREKVEASNTKIKNVNALIEQYQKAVAEKNWAAAEPIIKQMIEADPNRWEFYQALGNAQISQQEYADAAASFQKAIDMAQGVVSGSIPKDPKNPSTDPVKAKSALGPMLTSQGNALLKMGKPAEGIAAFTKAAELDPNPGTAYFNLCATQYNTGNIDGALAACDKAIAADPQKADAYFIKGSLLFGTSVADKDGKVKAPAGTDETLKKYLELAPEGPHAADVKQMLEFIGSKVETTFKSGKKK